MKNAERGIKYIQNNVELAKRINH